MKEKTVSEITKTMKKTVKPQSGVWLGAAIDDNNNIQDKPDKTMDVDVMETNNDDILDEEDEKENTEDSDTYSRNKKMHLCNNKSTSTKNIHNMQGKLEKMTWRIMVSLERSQMIYYPKKLARVDNTFHVVSFATRKVTMKMMNFR